MIHLQEFVRTEELQTEEQERQTKEGERRRSGASRSYTSAPPGAPSAPGGRHPNASRGTQRGQTNPGVAVVIVTAVPWGLLLRDGKHLMPVAQKKSQLNSGVTFDLHQEQLL